MHPSSFPRYIPFFFYQKFMAEIFDPGYRFSSIKNVQITDFSSVKKHL